MPVSETVNAITEPARARVSFVGLQPLSRQGHADVHLAALGELERVGEQVLHHLAQAPGGRWRCSVGVGRELHREGHALWSATWSKSRSRPTCNSAMSSWLISSVTVPDSTFARSRMSSSSRSRSVPEEWMTLAYCDLRVGQVLVVVARQLAREDQQAVERRAQLVRHVREELGLVLRRDRELLGLLLDQALGPLDLLVLALDLGVLLGQAARPGVRGPRWSRAAPPAARLKLLRLGLRLLEQVLGEGWPRWC